MFDWRLDFCLGFVQVCSHSFHILTALHFCSYERGKKLQMCEQCPAAKGRMEQLEGSVRQRFLHVCHGKIAQTHLYIPSASDFCQMLFKLASPTNNVAKLPDFPSFILTGLMDSTRSSSTTHSWSFSSFCSPQDGQKRRPKVSPGVTIVAIVGKHASVSMRPHVPGDGWSWATNRGTPRGGGRQWFADACMNVQPAQLRIKELEVNTQRGEVTLNWTVKGPVWSALGRAPTVCHHRPWNLQLIPGISR